jgi:hypothetical protein
MYVCVCVCVHVFAALLLLHSSSSSPPPPRRSLPPHSDTLWMNGIGVGTSRMRSRDGGHRAALQSAIAHGVNLIDSTVAEVGVDGQRLVGDVLVELACVEERVREELLLTCRVGLLSGGVQVASGEEADVIPLNANACLAVGPETIRNALCFGRQNLGVDAVEFALLDMPEALFARHPSAHQALLRVFEVFEQVG